MVGPTRLELVTFSMSRKRSNQLSYGPDSNINNGQGGNRTLTTLRPQDFKSCVYAIPPLAQN